MKIRVGFVSNSSSSSFCIIGTDSPRAISWIAEKQGYKLLPPWQDEDYQDAYPNFANSEPDADYGLLISKNTKTPELTHKIIYVIDDTSRITLAGYHAPDILKTMTIPEAQAFFVKEMEKINLHLSEDEVALEYGESSSE